MQREVHLARPRADVTNSYVASITPAAQRNMSVFLCVFVCAFVCAMPFSFAEEAKQATETGAKTTKTSVRTIPPKTQPKARKQASKETSTKPAQRPAAKRMPSKRRRTVKRSVKRRVIKRRNVKTRRKVRRKRKKKAIWVPRVDVIGERPAELDSVAGSADVMNEKELKSRTPLNAGEALRTMPGVNVYAEDGMGLRLNIGIRGLDPVRGRKILVLEDGVPIAMAPYGEPELYYTPRIERMKRLEIVKGSGAILWGPQTIGGVLNFITRSPPRKFQLTAEARYGSYDYFQAQASVGDTINKRFGYLFEVLHQRYTGPTRLNLSATDVSGKMVVRITPYNILGVKLQFYDEMSNATYLGLTTPQYENDPFANHAYNDRFPIRRVGGSLNHKLLLGMAGLINTQFYAHFVRRYWKRQDFNRSGDGGNVNRIVDGSNSEVTKGVADGSSIFFKDSTGNRNREFGVTGLESRYTVEYSLGPVENELIAGVRFHYEHGDEQYLNGETAQSPAGSIRDQESRDLFAIAAYVQNSFMFLNRKLKITPGFRFESMWFHRRLDRTRVTQPDGSSVPTDVNVSENSTMVAPIPGIGISFEVSPGVFLFGGVHRGFAPPRTKDSITSDGEDLQLDPEFSWNYELGLRMRRGNYFMFQAAAFFMDFQNQVIPPSESSGAVASDPNNLGKTIINAGQTFHAGGEASVTFDLPAFLKAPLRLPLQLSYTWVPVAIFADGKFEGNRLPYAPEHTLTATLRLELPVGLNMMVSANYVSEQTTDKGATKLPSVDGLVGMIDGRFLLNARIGYTFRLGRRSVGVFVSGKNLTNSVYISTRRPQGIRAGAPMQIVGGLQGKF
ncbi:MAG TPA: hypothetical protein DCE42_29415 [Myxococcales bacterium]|nr:hypothetical protein [Deltaproteobacteria bacterium]MBU47370.1 hypothetical protein [Deltaproteobacteria bacterium]HAA58912.1 hypothetical protein [Myxococcales bacterium]